MADDGDMPPTPPSGTPSAGAMPPPGVAAGNAAPGGTPQGQGPGILPPQSGGAGMPVRQIGAHASFVDILRAVHMALKKSIGMAIPGSKEEKAAIKALTEIGNAIHTGDQGKEDQVDPMQRVQEAIQMRKMQGQGGPPGGAPPGGGMPPPTPQPNTGPIPMAGAMR